MKIKCPNCGQFAVVNLKNNMTASKKCENCHNNFEVTMFGERYELLFDLGAAYYVAGQYREAVFNWASALERAIESFVKYVIYSKLSENEREDKYSKYWKLLESSSERQLGSFASIFITELGIVPDFLDSNSLMSSIRNKVVHKGEIPTAENALKYGENVYALILQMIKALVGKLDIEFFQLSQMMLAQRHKISMENILAATRLKGGTHTATLNNSPFFFNVFAFFISNNYHDLFTESVRIAGKNLSAETIRARAKLNMEMSFKERLDILKDDLLGTFML